MNPDEALGEKLRQAQEASGRSIREVADRMDTSPAHLHRLFKGLNSPTVDTLRRFVAATGVAVHLHLEPKEGS